jgi:GT2 family glycosyltransferase
MSIKPIFSIITVIHNREKMIPKVLDSIKKQSFKDYEVIIVDAVSSDRSLEIAKKIFPKARFINLKKNIGVANYNFGFKAAKGKYLLSIDDDVTIEKDILAKLYQKFQSSDADIISFKILKGASMRMVDNVGHSTIGSRETGYETEYLNSAAWSFTRDVFRKTGGYNKEYFIYIMEMELCTRSINKGLRVRYFPDLVAHHYFGRSKERIGGKYFVARNWIYFITQFLPVWAIPLFAFWSVAKVSYDTSHGYGKTGSYLRGFADGVAKLPHFLKKRSPMNYRQTTLFMKTQFAIGGFTNKW